MILLIARDGSFGEGRRKMQENESCNAWGIGLGALCGICYDRYPVRVAAIALTEPLEMSAVTMRVDTPGYR